MKLLKLQKEVTTTTYYAINTEKEFFEGVSTYIHVYNSKRPHSVLMNRTLDRYESKYFSVHKDKSNSETEH